LTGTLQPLAGLSPDTTQQEAIMTRKPKPTRHPKPSRGMPRSLIYAMIPLGFLLLVGIMILTGYWTEETADAPTVVEQDLTPAD
jgi:hypothetical protein